MAVIGYGSMTYILSNVWPADPCDDERVMSREGQEISADAEAIGVGRTDGKETKRVAKKKIRKKKKKLPWNDIPCAECGRPFRGAGVCK